MVFNAGVGADLVEDMVISLGGLLEGYTGFLEQICYKSDQAIQHLVGKTQGPGASEVGQD